MALTDPLVTINLVGGGTFVFPEPTEYESNSATIVDNARNTAGCVIGSIIRQDVAKISMSWSYLSITNWSNILKCFNSAHGTGGRFYASVTFFLQDTAAWVTRTMYVSDRNASMFIRDPAGNIQGYQNCKLSLIEV